MSAETSPDLPACESEGESFGLVIRVLLIAAVFAAASIALRNCIEVGWMITEMRENAGQMKPPPPIAEWAFDYRTIFIFAIVFVPMMSLGTFALRDRGEAYIALSALALLSIIGALLMYAAELLLYY